MAAVLDSSLKSTCISKVTTVPLSETDHLFYPYLCCLVPMKNEGYWYFLPDFCFKNPFPFALRKLPTFPKPLTNLDEMCNKPLLGWGLRLLYTKHH